FDVAAIDYLLKPYDRTRLRQTLARVQGRGTSDLHGRLLALAERLGAGAGGLDRRVDREGEGVRVLGGRGVGWVESAVNVCVGRVGSSEQLVRTTLQRLESRLDPAHFIRIHRRLIVNLDRIREGRLGAKADYEVVLQDGHVLPVGRRYRDRLLLENAL